MPTIGERAETQQAVSQGSLVVWGTDVDVSLSKEKFKNFMFFYVNDDAKNEEVDPTLPYCIQRLEEIQFFFKLI